MQRNQKEVDEDPECLSNGFWWMMEIAFLGATVDREVIP